MSSRLQEAFEKAQGHKAFIGFVTGGDPSLEKSEEFILEMVRAGTDIVEIGIPFSDPIAEGPVIQEANLRALKAGTTLEGIFGLVEKLRRQTQVPLVFLTYLNPVFQYGYERFFKRCRLCGVDGIIVPDLPFEEQQEVQVFSDPQEVDMISLVAPTSAARIQEIALAARGFLYVVSSLGVTGVRGKIETNLAGLIGAVGQVSSIPAAVGFGIHTPEQAASIWKFADGVIVGSAIVKLVAQYGADAGPHIYEYVRSITTTRRGGEEGLRGAG
ncbi:MAG: tryptophan synthase subunit alpha [Spirochaetaceae bacterium]|jgi:tryptophan synthase alpha chain|nr:tryptophan synthase subunit alpha [Spirochaetaceae bacterium]